MIHPRISALACAALVASSPAAAQNRIHVNANITTPGNGSSWGLAFRDLGTALATAQANDEVWVAAGTYQGSFSVPAVVTVYGGFRSGDTRRTQRSLAGNATILDGTDTERVLVLSQRSVVDGLFVARGRANAPGGAGVLILGAMATIRNCAILENNITGGRGSAVYIGRDTNGRGADPRIENTVFARNGKATSLGHAIDIEGSSGTFRNILVYDNHDNGLHIQAAATADVRNSSFVDNSGRGLCLIDNASRLLLENSHFHNNQAGHVFAQGSNYPTIAQVNALAYAKDNIEGDARFTDPSNDDFTLQSSSPLIEAGQDIADLYQDIDGNVRRLDGDRDGLAVTDIGPIEHANVYLELIGTPARGATVTIDSDGWNGAPMVMAIGLDLTPSPIFVGQLGYVLVDFGAAAVYGWAPVGTGVPVTIPTTAPSGVAVVLQAAAGTGAWGNLSGPLDFWIR